MSQDKTYGKILSNGELAAFCGQLALILGSGLSAAEGLMIMTEDAAANEEKALLAALQEETEISMEFSSALEKSGCFPAYMIKMVRLGEETGRLDQVMSALSDHYEREDALRHMIRGAITYPLIMTGMMIAVIIVLLTKVMPVFNQVFIQLGMEMTSFSGVLLQLGNHINRYTISLVLILAAIILVILVGLFSEGGRRQLLRFGRRFALIRGIAEDTAVSRIASGLSLALASGLSPEHCLTLVSELTEDEDYRRRLNDARTALTEGMPLAQALHSQGILSGTASRLALIGERTGSLEQSMAHIADLSRTSADERIGSLLAVLEPTLVIILSVIVGVILLSVMLPLMGIMSGI